MVKKLTEKPPRNFFTFPFLTLEKSHRFFVVRNQHILIAAVMVEHHFVVCRVGLTIKFNQHQSYNWRATNWVVRVSLSNALYSRASIRGLILRPARQWRFLRGCPDTKYLDAANVLRLSAFRNSPRRSFRRFPKPLRLIIRAECRARMVKLKREKYLESAQFAVYKSLCPAR